MVFENKNNTPPRSPEMEDQLEIDEGDMLEVIELDDLDDLMDDEDNDMADVPEEEEEDFQPQREDAFIVLKHHSSCVISCAFHPLKPNIVATGGMDDVACVVDYSSETANVLLTSPTKESVDCVKFSSDGKFLCVVDVDGLVKIFDGDNFTLHQEFELEEEYRWVCWHQVAPILVAATPSMVIMYNIPTKVNKVISACTDGSISCGKLFPDGKKLAYCTTLGTVKTIDMKTGECLCSVTVKCPDSEQKGIYCMDIHKDGASILCGCDSGDIVLINVNTSKIGIFPRLPGVNTESVEVVEYAKTEEQKNMAASCHLSGQLRVWDTVRQAVRCGFDTDSTIVSLKWHPTEPYIFTCQTDPKVLLIDARNGTLIRSFFGHTRMLLAIDITSDGSKIVTASNDETARIYNVNTEPERLMDVAMAE